MEAKDFVLVDKETVTQRAIEKYQRALMSERDGESLETMPKSVYNRHQVAAAMEASLFTKLPKGVEKSDDLLDASPVVIRLTAEAVIRLFLEVMHPDENFT